MQLENEKRHVIMERDETAIDSRDFDIGIVLGNFRN